MTAKGYTTNAKVAAELGRTFSGAQQAQADAMIEVAEATIDRLTGRAWMVSSPVTDEWHVLDGPIGWYGDRDVPRVGPDLSSAAPVYLKRKPVTAVTAVRLRTQAIGASDSTLASGTGYELVDTANGILLVAGAPGSVAKVSYTHSGPAVPADIAHATAVLAGHLMTHYLNPQSATYRRISVGAGDVTVDFRDLDANALPGYVQTVIAAYRPPFVFA